MLAKSAPCDDKRNRGFPYAKTRNFPIAETFFRVRIIIGGRQKVLIENKIKKSG